MTIFLDTTALLARYIEGPAHDVVVAATTEDRDWCASATALSEALMLIERLGDDPTRGDELRRCLRDDWECVNVVPVDALCLETAAELGRSQPVRTIDALHLAAADRLGRPMRYATFEPGQITVALAMGFDVISTSESTKSTTDRSRRRPATRRSPS